MSRHVISVCIFCFICATHSPCASHAAVHGENVVKYKEYHSPHDPPAVDNRPLTSREKLKPDTLRTGLEGDDNGKHLEKRNSDNDNISSRTHGVNSDEYVKRLFRMFGDGESMTIEGFKRLVGHLDLHHGDHLIHEETDHEELDKPFKFEGEKDTNETCITEEQLSSILDFEASEPLINETFFYKTCPLLIYSIVGERCTKETQNDFPLHNVSPFTNSITWLCSMAAVILISACGILALAIIPVMQKRFYKPLIQFLVALAVGTLAGDALLHLLPHAMSPSEDHSHPNSHAHIHAHDENTMKGCVAMLGLTFFFIMERLISLAGKWRKGKKKHTHSHVTVIKDRRESMSHKNNTQCMDKYNPFPFCYKDIMNNPNKAFLESDRTATTMLDTGSNSDIQSCKKSRSPTIEKLETNQNVIECIGDPNNTPETNKMLSAEHKHDDDYTVILREHRNDHHGHSHKHGHVHAAPQNFSSVAWMVIMGDGLHNFTDGMAIGAAFSGGLAGGFSTTVAVFCHELPHELGDFAMLLKAGMSIKQALFYNILSSVLCVFGNIFGMVLGNTEYASSWVFAAAAGMFIYIALVDMIPELSSAHEDEGNIIQCVLHLGGLLLGFGIMVLIAFYEHDLKTIFNDPE